MRLVITLLLAVAAFLFPAEQVSAQDSLSDRTLVDELRKGGYVIYFRHAATDWSQADHVPKAGEWVSCDPQKMRQLSEEGRAVARRVGAAIRRLGIPIDLILSSEYCRTRETAELMNLGEVTPTRAIMNMRVADMVGGREAVTKRAQQELGRKPKHGTNTIIVAHGNLMRAASGAYTDEAGAGVFAPKGGGDFLLVKLLSPEDWKQLAEKFADN